MGSYGSIRYYMGRHEILLKEVRGKKGFIMHLQKGFVGNKKCGYKEVQRYDFDIVLIRHCYHNKR